MIVTFPLVKEGQHYIGIGVGVGVAVHHDCYISTGYLHLYF